MTRLPRQVEERLQARDMLSEESIDLKPDPRRKYSYLCDGGHYSDSPYEMTTCPLAYCARPLRRVGKGSKPKGGPDTN